MKDSDSYDLDFKTSGADKDDELMISGDALGSFYQELARDFPIGREVDGVWRGWREGDGVWRGGSVEGRECGGEGGRGWSVEGMEGGGEGGRKWGEGRERGGKGGAGGGGLPTPACIWRPLHNPHPPPTPP